MKVCEAIFLKIGAKLVHKPTEFGLIALWRLFCAAGAILPFSSNGAISFPFTDRFTDPLSHYDSNRLPREPSEIHRLRAWIGGRGVAYFYT